MSDDPGARVDAGARDDAGRADAGASHDPHRADAAGSDDAQRGAGEVAIDPAARMDALAREVLPALVARLGSSRLGELEVRSDGWRVRLRRARGAATSRTGGGAGRAAGPGGGPGPIVARSPGVGYFDPGPRLVVGEAVTRGDRLGSVDVLGVEQEVSAPADGVIGRIHVEAGQAVEYGEILATLNEAGRSADDLEAAPDAPAAAGPPAADGDADHGRPADAPVAD